MTVKEACDRHLGDIDLVAKDGKTFCNFFVQRVCRDLGYEFFSLPKPWGMLANQIHEYCQTANEWLYVEGARTVELALSGKLVIATAFGNPHGHVAIGYEGPSVFSSKWKQRCPLVAHAKDKPAIEGANFAFAKIPLYFVWRGDDFNV